VTKTFLVFSNDPKFSQTQLTLKGNVTPKINMIPATGVYWGRIKPNTSRSQKVRIINNTAAPMTLEALPPAEENKSFSFKVVEIKPGKEYSVEISAKPPFKEGLNLHTFKFKTGLDDPKEISIPCNLYLPPDIEIIPKLIVLNSPTKIDYVRTLRIRYNGDGSVEVKSPQTENKNIKLELTKEKIGKNYILRVSIPKGFAVNEEEPDKITISVTITKISGEKETKELSIPFQTNKRSPFTRIPGNKELPVQPE